MKRRAVRAVVFLFAAAALSACTSVVKETADEIRIDTGFVGEIVPGTRGWWGHLQAGEHCAQYGKRAELVDYQGAVAVYRCIKPPKA